MREVDDVQHPVDQREAQRHQRIDGADGQPVEGDRREDDRVERTTSRSNYGKGVRGIFLLHTANAYAFAYV